jgi:hypothetical protein
MENMEVSGVLIKATKKLHENNFIQIKDGNQLSKLYW